MAKKPNRASGKPATPKASPKPTPKPAAKTAPKPTAKAARAPKPGPKAKPAGKPAPRGAKAAAQEKGRPTAATKADPALIEGLADGADRIALFHELMQRVHDRGTGQGQSQDGQSQSQRSATPPELTHALIGAVRGLGIPARYVTGYLLGNDGAASFHAWAEGWDDNLGWIGFDPLLNLCPIDSHIRLASGLDATSTMPIRSAPVWSAMPLETVEIVAG